MITGKPRRVSLMLLTGLVSGVSLLHAVAKAWVVAGPWYAL
jgi:hypothetical protein